MARYPKLLLKAKVLMVERHIEAVFCDDIRQELHNKVSLIGVYAADMVVDRLPAMLPRLCVWANIVTPIERPFEKLRLRLVQEERVLLETDDIAGDGGQMNDVPPDAKRIVTNAVFTLSPYQIDGDTWLQLVAETEEDELTSRKLRISQRKPDSESD